MSGATKILMSSGGVDLPSDDEFDNVSFLSHFDGSNNGTNNVFDDGSDENHSITVGSSGTVTQGTFGPFARVEGEWSNWFDGTNDVIHLDASGSDFNFGTGDFTIEGWLYNDGTGHGTYAYHLAAGNMLQFYTYQHTRIIFNMTYSEGGASAFALEGTPGGSGGSLPLNQWHHWAITKEGSNASIFINGTRNATSSSVSGTFSAPTGNMFVGAYNATPDYEFGGYISNVRIVKGTAVYDPTSSSCTVPTSGLTEISGTSLLTCQSNRFKDNSSSAHALTVVGIPEVRAFTPILTSKVYKSGTNGASVYFDQTTNSYLTASDATDFDFGTGDYTVEMWAYPNAGFNTSWAMTFSTTGVNQYWAWTDGGGTESNAGLSVYNGTSGPISGSNADIPPIGAWSHIVFQNTSGTYNWYLNGRRVYNTAQAEGHSASATGVMIGRSDNYSSSYFFGGYLSDVRVVKGSCAYTNASTLTVPTAPLTKITNTKLLLNMADGQALDSAAQNNMTLYGTADTSTTQQKFGTASLFLEGDSDTDFVQLHGVKDLSGPFTIECWARAADTDNAWLWCNGQYTVELGIDGDNLRMTPGSGGYTNFFTGGEFTVNTWHHVALVRDTSNVIKCYLNGTASSTTYTDATSYVATSGIFIIGGEWRSSTQIFHGWDGYVDDFRISRFARYTSNFTAPTEAFPDKGQ